MDYGIAAINGRGLCKNILTDGVTFYIIYCESSGRWYISAWKEKGTGFYFYGDRETQNRSTL